MTSHITVTLSNASDYWTNGLGLGCIHIDTSMSPGIRVRVIVNMNLHVFQWSRSH